MHVKLPSDGLMSHLQKEFKFNCRVGYRNIGKGLRERSPSPPPRDRRRDSRLELWSSSNIIIPKPSSFNAFFYGNVGIGIGIGIGVATRETGAETAGAAAEGTAETGETEGTGAETGLRLQSIHPPTLTLYFNTINHLYSLSELSSACGRRDRSRDREGAPKHDATDPAPAPASEN